MLPAINIKLLKSIDGSAPRDMSFLSVVQENDLTVIDLWHTKCTRCPAAIEKLNGFAGDFTSGSKVSFYTCALSQGPADVDTVDELIQE
jgi:thiol-disulfide isomerase/thioredoxin